METWFRVNGLGSIEPVDVVTWTKHTLILANGRRVKRVNNWDEYFPTWTRARNRAIANAAAKVREAEEALDKAREEFRAANSIPAIKNISA
jgi:hypothetical protein